MEARYVGVPPMDRRSMTKVLFPARLHGLQVLPFPAQIHPDKVKQIVQAKL